MYLKINFLKKIFKNIKFFIIFSHKKGLSLVKYKLQSFISYSQTTGWLDGFQSKASSLGSESASQ